MYLLLVGLRIGVIVLGESMSAHSLVIQSFMAWRPWHQELEEAAQVESIFRKHSGKSKTVLISKIRVLSFWSGAISLISKEVTTFLSVRCSKTMVQMGKKPLSLSPGARSSSYFSGKEILITFRKLYFLFVFLKKSISTLMSK